jgi:hypothetical protein
MYKSIIETKKLKFALQPSFYQYIVDGHCFIYLASPTLSVMPSISSDHYALKFLMELNTLDMSLSTVIVKFLIVVLIIFIFCFAVVLLSLQKTLLIVN